MENNKMMKKSCKLQNDLLKLVPKKYLKKASDMLYKIVEIEIEIEQRCNQ